MFERFTRAETSRARRDGGDIQAALPEGGGLWIGVTLPTVDASQ
ncbi:two-component system sensor protein [Cronobacter sakazakii 701]|nr:two-component system sensor protein [Cronobacter sakazakii 701]